MVPDKEIYGVRKNPNGEKGFWERIGIGFKNKDGSISLIFRYFPTEKDIKIIVQDTRKKSNVEAP